MNLRKLTKIILLPFLVIVISCSSEATYTEEVIDGVRHVHNLTPKWGDEPKVKLEFVMQYGDLMAEDEDYQLFRPMDANVDSEGNVYILDSGNYLVKKFDREGNFLFSFGNKGQGPGEFGSLSKLEIDRDDNLYITDFSNSTVHIFDNNGKLIKGIKDKKIRPRVIKLLNNGDFALFSRSIIIIGDDEKPEAKNLLKIMDREGNIKSEFLKERVYDDNMMQSIGNSISFVLDEEENYYVSFNSQNRIEKYSNSGKLIWKADRLLGYEESKTVETNEIKMSDGGTAFSISFNSFANGLNIDHKDRLWIKTFKIQRPDDFQERVKNGEKIKLTMIEIYDNNGILLGRLDDEFLKDSFTLRIIGDRIFFMEILEEMVVYEYKIVEN